MIAGEGALSVPGFPLRAGRQTRPAGPRALQREIGWAERARGGDGRAFGRLYERFAPSVHGVLISMVPSQEAQDLVQEVFVRALRSIETLDDPARVGGWLATIARNVGRDAHRRREPVEELPAEPVAAPAGQRASEDDREQAERVLGVLRELPEAYRETLALRLVEGLSGPEIAERIGMTHGSVRVNLCRGMKLLRERLGVDS